MRVIDGMHRLRAAELRGEDTINVHYFDGDDHEAFVLAVKTNVTHGLPLTLTDRAAAVRRIITSYPCWSDRAIATITSVSAKTVATIRRCATEEGTQLHTRIGRDGRARPLDMTERRRRASQLIADNPKASLREIAKAAGISPGTVRNVRARLRDGKDPILPRRRNAQYRGETPHRKSAGKQGGADRAHQLVSTRASILCSLRRDPSLRFTEAGRIILRLIDAHTMDPQEWQRLAGHVPVHCVDAVLSLARGCASDWQEFARLLEQRRHHAGHVRRSGV
jgi:transposase